MKPFSFIHAADLHLGSPFKGVGTRLPAAAEALGAATYEAFSGLVELCLQKSVDFLLVAGDVFDLAGRSLRAQLTFRDGLARLSDAGIQSFTALGNHDPWDAWPRRISWPRGAHLFSPGAVETIPVAVGGTPVAAVSGISYGTQHQPKDLSEGFLAAHPDLYQIAMLHTNCGNNPDHGAYAPCSLEALRRAGFDYWALGHVHEKKVLETRPHIVYPGCIQGLSIREAGARGCFLVSVSDHRHTELSFEPLHRIQWQSVDIDITGLETLEDLDQSLMESLAETAERGEGRPVIVRMRLVGQGELYKPLRQPSVMEDLLARSRELGDLQSPSVWIQDLAVDCRPAANLDQRAAMEDLLGQVLQNAQTLGLHPQDLPKHLMPALSDLFRHPRLSRYLQIPSPAELQTLLQEAALICYDHLEPDP